MHAVVMVLALAVLAGGCAPKNFTKQGANAEQYAQDEASCRAQVRQIAQKDRDIEDQRRAVFAGERDRYGQQDLYKTMDNQGYVNNTDRLMARCMEGRGWAPKNPSPWPKLSW